MKKKLLIVDDDFADELSDALQLHGDFEIEIAKDGGEAIEKAVAFKPDIVLLDIQLPVMDGYEVLAELKKRELETRVVMFSGHFFGADTAVRCIRNGACDFIEKPVRISEVVERLKKYVLTEATLNVRVSDPVPIVDKLTSRVEDLQSRNRDLATENKALKQPHFYRDLAAKAVYVGIALGSILLLNYFQIASGTLSLVLSFILLVLLLMIPIDRIQRITTGLRAFSTKVDLK